MKRSKKPGNTGPIAPKSAVEAANAQKKSKTVLAWHFLPDDRLTRFSRLPVREGETISVSGPLQACANGLHASLHPYDAFGYYKSFTLCRVELSGEMLTESDKLCARNRKCLAIRDVKKAVLLFAADCAERALGTVKTPDPRSIAAVRAVREFAEGRITKGELEAARSAARDAWRIAYDAAADAAARQAFQQWAREQFLKRMEEQFK